MLPCKASRFAGGSISFGLTGWIGVTTGAVGVEGGLVVALATEMFPGVELPLAESLVGEAFAVVLASGGDKTGFFSGAGFGIAVTLAELEATIGAGLGGGAVGSVRFLSSFVDLDAPAGTADLALAFAGVGVPDPRSSLWATLDGGFACAASDFAGTGFFVAGDSTFAAARPAETVVMMASILSF